MFELFEFPNDCTWHQCKIFRPQEYHLRSGERIECIVLGFSELVSMLHDKKKAREAFDLHPKELSRMRSEIEYTDITEDEHFMLIMDFEAYIGDIVANAARLVADRQSDQTSSIEP